MHGDDHHDHEHDHDHDHEHDHDHDDHDHGHDYDFTEVDHDADGRDSDVPHYDNNPVEEGSKLHLEMHRMVDELGKYAIEMEIKSEEGLKKSDLIGFIEDMMHASASDCFRHGADLIGHIKSFLKVGEQSVMCSMVDESIPIRVQDHIQADVIYDGIFVLHVIVHGIWDDVIRECTLEVLPGIAKKWGVPYRIMADYYDTEKSIAHHEK